MDKTRLGSQNHGVAFDARAAVQWLLPAEAFIKDLDGKYLFVNRQFASRYGVSLADLGQKRYTDADFYDAEKHDQTVVHADQPSHRLVLHPRVG